MEKNDISEFILSRIVLDLTKIKNILEDENNSKSVTEAKIALDELLAKIQEVE